MPSRNAYHPAGYTPAGYTPPPWGGGTPATPAGPVPALVPAALLLLMRRAGATGATGAPVAADLLDAICMFARSDSELATAIPGGMWIHATDQNVGYPYASVFEVGDGLYYPNTGPVQVVDRLIQFSVFARNSADGLVGAQTIARDTARLIRRKYRRRPLKFQSGYWIGAEARPSFGMPPDNGRGDARVVQYIVQFDYLVGEALS